MSRISKAFLVAAVAAVATTSASIAAEPAKRSASAAKRQDAAAAAQASRPPVANALGGASSTARLAALVDQGGGVVRSKGVAAVTHPSTGIYCIRPAAGTGVNPRDIIPTMSVDYSNSRYPESHVQYRSAGLGCPVNSIAVVTIADVDLDGDYGFVDSVAFTIVVD